MEKEIVYVADLDQDIDDVVAAHYLNNDGVLKCVVCDPYPRSQDGIVRKEKLESLGITVLKKMPPVAKYVFIGGALTVVADYARFHRIEWLVMNGGYVGANLCKHELDKFKGKNTVRTYNFNCDVVATDSVLRSDEKHIGNIVLVGKNVCHDPRNTRSGLWSDGQYKALFDEYHVKEHKLQHDLLACHEGISFLFGKPKFCTYNVVRPYNTGLNGNMTSWGSTKTMETPYRKVLAAVGYVSEERRK